jgi:nucleoside-diphosphate-sugar epimerase
MQPRYEGFCPTVLRLSTGHGLSQRQRFDLVVNLLTIKGLAEGKFQIFGGDQWRPHISAWDVADACRVALEAPLEKVKRQIFNIVSENMRILDVGKLVVEMVPGTRMDVRQDAADKRNYRVTGAKAERVLGFVPQKKVRGRHPGDGGGHSQRPHRENYSDNK